MQCDQIKSRLSAYMDGEVAPAERMGMEGHLAVCTECAAALEELKKVSKAIRRMQTAGVDAALMARLHEGVEIARRGRGGLKVEWLAGGLSAAAAVVAVVMGLQLMKTSDAVAAAPDAWEGEATHLTTNVAADDASGTDSRQTAMAQWMVADLSSGDQRHD